MNLHGEEDIVLSLKLGKDGDKVGFEQARDVRLDKAVKPDWIGLEPLEFFGNDEAFFPQLLLPPPYRKAWLRSQTGNETGRTIYDGGGLRRSSSQCKSQH